MGRQVRSDALQGLRIGAVRAGVRRRAAAAFFAGLSFALRGAAACEPAAAVELPLVPGTLLGVDVVAGSDLLLEELGVDVEYRWGDEEAFAAVDAPPARLGFAVLTARSARLALSAKSGQGGGRVRLSTCLDSGDVLFYVQLSGLHMTSMRAGTGAALEAVPLVERLQWLPWDRIKRAWISSAYANVLLSAGKMADSARAFSQAHDDWHAAGRPDRAAVALMARGENASRSGHFDEADELLQRARAELARHGIAYYALRSEGASCNVLSRRGRFAESIACEERVVRGMSDAGELIEAATRQISLSNQYMRRGDFERSRELLLAADAAAPRMTAVVRSRLDSTWGSYYLYTGDIPAAAGRFALAAAGLGGQGLPGDQALIDLKLASLASLSGARVERRRLLERAATRLSRRDSAPLLADNHLQLARVLRELGDPSTALVQAQLARELCRSIDDRECAERSRVTEADALIDLGMLDLAAAQLSDHATSDATLTQVDAAMAQARLQLALGRPEFALLNLPDTATFADDLNLQARQVRLKAASLAALGDRRGALAVVDGAYTKQLRQVQTWPSAALRISARNRLAELQVTLFGLLLAQSSGVIDPLDFDKVRRAIDDGSVHELFRLPSGLVLPDAVRRALSVAVLDAKAGQQRELFLALAQDAADPAVDTVVSNSVMPAAAAPETLLPDERTLVLLPLLGDYEFMLLAWRGGNAKLCRRWPVEQYQQLVARFEQALDGDDAHLAELDSAAAEWHAMVRACDVGPTAAQRWTTVAVPGTRPLPWAWIAAAGPDPVDEPLVTTTFGFPQGIQETLARPGMVILLDLNMPHVESLPFAARERSALEDLLGSRGIPQRSVIGADATPDDVLQILSTSRVVHVIGHANPAAYGQLYQGLWFESERKPSLLTYPEIAATPSQAELVVLSSCGTNVAAQSAFGATSRLAEAFIAAGAKHVVAASNALSDTAAPIWTRVFHDSLWESGDVAAAARDARRALRGSPHFRHPKFWAGIEVYLGRR